MYKLIAVDNDGVELSVLHDDLRELIERANKLSKQGFSSKVFVLKEIFEIKQLNE